MKNLIKKQEEEFDKMLWKLICNLKFEVKNKTKIENPIKNFISEIRKKQTKEIEQLRVQLAGCSVAALGGISKDNLAKIGDYGWSAAYQDVLDLRLKYDKCKDK